LNPPRRCAVTDPTSVNPLPITVTNPAPAFTSSKCVDVPSIKLAHKKEWDVDPVVTVAPSEIVVPLVVALTLSRDIENRAYAELAVDAK